MARTVMDEVSYVGLDMAGALLVEIILTFVFVFTILGVTAKAKTGTVAGLVIGLTLTFVHILRDPAYRNFCEPGKKLWPGSSGRERNRAGAGVGLHRGTAGGSRDRGGDLRPAVQGEGRGF